MSSRLPAVKDRLTEIKSMLAAIKGREGYAAGLQLRLGRVTNIVLENESKVWMRRRVGEQILKDLQDAFRLHPSSIWDGGILVDAEKSLLVDFPGGRQSRPEPQVLVIIDQALENEAFNRAARRVRGKDRVQNGGVPDRT